MSFCKCHEVSHKCHQADFSRQLAHRSVSKGDTSVTLSDTYIFEVSPDLLPTYQRFITRVTLMTLLFNYYAHEKQKIYGHMRHARVYIAIKSFLSVTSVTPSFFSKIPASTYPRKAGTP